VSGIGIEVDHNAKTTWTERITCDFCGVIISERDKAHENTGTPSRSRMTLETWTDFADEPKFHAHACSTCSPVIQDLLLSRMKAPPTGIQYLIVPGCEPCEGSGFVSAQGGERQIGAEWLFDAADLTPCLKCKANGYRRQDVDAALKAALEKTP